MKSLGALAQSTASDGAAKIPALFTDRYEFNMAQVYRAEGMGRIAVFELCYRKLPEHRNYIAVAGMAEAVEFLSGFRFTAEECAWLRERSRYSEAFVTSLENLRFTGDVYAPRFARLY